MKKLKNSWLYLALLITGLAGLFSACQSAKILQPNALITAKELNSFLLEDSYAAAHWLTKDIIAIPKNELFTKEIVSAQLINHEGTFLDKPLNIATLTATPLPVRLKNKHPHLADYQAFKVNISADQAKRWLKTGLVFVALFNNGDKQLTRVQFAKVLDDLYTTGENDADEVSNLGASIKFIDQNKQQVSFKLWAPTAANVEVNIHDSIGHSSNDQSVQEVIKLTENTATGIWSAKVTGDYHLAYYTYKVTVFHEEYQANRQGHSSFISANVTDPYSLSLSTNSKHSQIIDLSHPKTQPKGWQTQQDVALKAPEDAIIYETHIRDFSAVEKKLSNEKHRGKYKAFSEQNSDGINHLKALKQAGLNHIHLLPTFDLGTINENTAWQVSLTDKLAKVCKISPSSSLCQENVDRNLRLIDVLKTFDSQSSKAQQVISELRQVDNYNWGYDPFHYTVPEGSYATNPEGENRIIEFREMVQSLHNMGFRVVMDVVYNHTHAAGFERTAVLDKIVPTYYQRLHPITGQIEQSTCCDNTATEHVMMAKLMIDSLVTWAKDYKIDGFRFDLMGHQPKDAMLKAREAVRAVDADTYFYGEGWNFGEVANNHQFVQASQLELAGTEIGTFTDRLRDAVRGSSYNVVGFAHRKNQGIGNGLGTFNNEIQSADDLSQYFEKMNQIRIGLTGNLANFSLLDENGNTVSGKQINYGGQAAGYALDPADTINYVSKHDNQTLWDNSQYRLPFEATTEQRVRLHNQSLSYALLAQGLPFLHMGSEFMRSKSFLRDSYDYSDWFNAVDYSKQSNNYNVGLPPSEKDEKNWPLIRDLLAKNQGRDMVTASDIAFSAEVFKEFITIRSSSKLFRLETEQQILDKVSFLNTGKDQQLGIIAMLIDDTKGKSVDENIEQVLVIFNNNPNTKVFKHERLAGFNLHTIQKNGADNTTQKSVISSNDPLPSAQIPAFTTAVFVK